MTQHSSAMGCDAGYLEYDLFSVIHGQANWVTKDLNIGSGNGLIDAWWHQVIT